MDRFKFRVYIKYAKLLEDVDSFFIDNLKEKITLHFSDCHTKTMKLSDCILEQCTGLKDKNGKLIYEHDYVMINKIIYKVFWNKTKISLANILNGDIIDFIETEEMEIIGNEHEETNIRKI